MGDNDNQQEAPKKGNKLENPDSIPSAGGQKIGEEHQGESKMLGENSRSESVDAAGNADDIQARLEGKKVDEAKKGGDSGEKESTLHKVEDKLGMGKK